MYKSKKVKSRESVNGDRFLTDTTCTFWKRKYNMLFKQTYL